MIRLLLTTSVIIILFFNFSSCLNDKADLSDLCDTTYFAREIRPIISTNCAVEGCHVAGGTGNGDFTKFAEIARRTTEIRYRINLLDSDPNHMPQGGTLSADLINKLNEWIDSGAKGCQ